MSLIRYTHPMMNLQQQINRMFDQFDTDLFGRLEELGDGFFAPAVDVKEDNEAYSVYLEVPGVKQENLGLTLQDNVLTIKGTKEQQTQSEGRYRRVERSYGSFVRSLSLPRNVDEGGVTANLQDGVLEVRLPKRAEARPRQIAVSTTYEGGSGTSGNAIEAGEENAAEQNAQTQAPASTGTDSAAATTHENAVGENSADAPEGNPS